MKWLLLSLFLAVVCLAPAWAAAKWLPLSITLVGVVAGLAIVGYMLAIAATLIIGHWKVATRTTQ